MFRLSIDEHLELRLLEPHHAEALFDAVDADRARLRIWLPWVDSTREVEDTRTFITGQLAKLAKQEELTAGLFVDGRIAGVIGARLSPLPPSADIGYWIAAEFEGRGLMTKAVAAMIDHLFTERDLHRVEIRCAVDNERSAAIPRRLGFKLEGVERESQQIQGRFLDHNRYGLIRGEWTDSPAG